MIAQLRGVVSQVDLDHVVLDVQGVGYLIYLSSGALKDIRPGEERAFRTYLSVRENALDLFGFLDEAELSLFRLLISVPGIGPKSALAVLSLSAPETLVRAIANEDITYLTKVSGIGKKTAEKIVVELKDKVGGTTEKHEMGGDADVIDVLVSLGYSQQEARAAVKKLNPDIPGASERVKEALKILGNR